MKLFFSHSMAILSHISSVFQLHPRTFTRDSVPVPCRLILHILFKMCSGFYGMRKVHYTILQTHIFYDRMFLLITLYMLGCSYLRDMEFAYYPADSANGWQSGAGVCKFYRQKPM